jgi:transcriptional regulator with XRE-family HTH domain
MADTAFQQALRDLAQQYTQKGIAAKTGLNQATISRLVNGRRMGSMKTIQKLLVAYPELGRFFVPENIPR